MQQDDCQDKECASLFLRRAFWCHVSGICYAGVTPGRSVRAG